MANSCESFGLQCTARSISIPSRPPPTNAIRIEAELNKLKNLKASSSLSVADQAIQDGLIGLAELYNCTQELTKSPTTQKSSYSTSKWDIISRRITRRIS
ncbi:hypothetical protein ACH5RR_011931 [Cinchona calisaya]|uniref:Uncharacterized protein n=1 Tax=Cinchona calisaya TaxID=153742 RepID=A0ABD3A9R0_9GENT